VKDEVKEQKEDEEENAPQDDEEGEKQKKFDPNNYNWTLSNGNSKNVL